MQVSMTLYSADMLQCR